jgi:hypothetical protein
MHVIWISLSNTTSINVNHVKHKNNTRHTLTINTC